jgi:hypothetical protein
MISGGAAGRQGVTPLRAANAEALVHLQGVRKMPLGRCIEWLDEDVWTRENINQFDTLPARPVLRERPGREIV